MAEKVETKLKPMKNEIDVYGRLKSLDLEEDTDYRGNERLKGDIVVLVEEKVGDESRSHEIRLGLYTRKYKSNGELNFFYNEYSKALKEYKTIDEVGDKTKADLVHVQGSLSFNQYIGQDGQKREFNRYNGKFINRVTYDQVKKAKGPKATVKIEALVEDIKDVLDSEGLPTDEKKLKALNVDFFGKLQDNSKPIVPFEAIVGEDLSEVFEDLYEKGETGKFTLKINNYAQEADPEEVNQEISGFGNTEELADVVRNFVNNLEVIGGTEPYVNGRELDEEQIEEVNGWIEKANKDLESGFVPDETNAFGEGSKKKENKKESKQVEEISDEELAEDFDF